MPPPPAPNTGTFTLHFQLHPRGVIRGVQTNGSQQGLFLNLKENNLRPFALGTACADAAGNVCVGRAQVPAGRAGRAAFILEPPALCVPSHG